MSEELRLRRLRIQSWRRGTREMDLILGRFSDEKLGALDASGLEGYEALLSENDQDLYDWAVGRSIVPPRHAAIIAQIRGYHRIV